MSTSLCPPTGSAATSAAPWMRLSTVAIWRPLASSTSRLGPKTFTAISPLAPERDSSTLSWITCEKLVGRPGMAASLPDMLSTRASLLAKRHSSWGLRSTRISMLLGPFGSVPSSGRPTWVITAFTSGYSSRVARTFCSMLLVLPRPDDWGRLMVSQMLPSSSLGRNSEPSSGASARATARQAPEAITVRRRRACSVISRAR